MVAKRTAGRLRSGSSFRGLYATTSIVSSRRAPKARKISAAMRGEANTRRGKTSARKAPARLRRAHAHLVVVCSTPGNQYAVLAGRKRRGAHTKSSRRQEGRRGAMRAALCPRSVAARRAHTHAVCYLSLGNTETRPSRRVRVFRCFSADKQAGGQSFVSCFAAPARFRSQSSAHPTPLNCLFSCDIIFSKWRLSKCDRPRVLHRPHLSPAPVRGSGVVGDAC